MTPGRKRIITMGVDRSNLEKATQHAEALGKAGKGAYVCLANVHMCMETYDSTEFRGVVNGADLVIADGRPIYWAQHLLGAEDAEHVRGEDIMNALCKASVAHAIKIGLYGGSSPQVLEQVKEQLEKNFPGILISYAYSPSFSPLTEEEDSELVNAVNSAEINVLFVGIGCPKQERWMAEHKDSLNCVMVGVGAAFDFIAGTKNHAPRWMQKLGMEWFFRLMSEPGRLWRRYLIQNPRFIFYFCRQWIFNKKY